MDIIDLGLNSEFLKVMGSAILGGMAFKVIERFLNSKEYADEQVTLRAELRAEMDKLKVEVNTLRSEVDEWREKYYHQVELTTSLHAQIASIKCELDEYKEHTGVFELPTMKKLELLQDEKDD
jgi:predicted  nucleic acid-binding Zn-ribbon protein